MFQVKARLSIERSRHVLDTVFTLKPSDVSDSMWSYQLIGTESLVDFRHQAKSGQWTMTALMFNRIMRGLAYVGLSHVTEADLLGPDRVPPPATGLTIEDEWDQVLDTLRQLILCVIRLKDQCSRG